MKKDPAIELARILGCFLVIGVHVSLACNVDGVWDTSKTVIAMLVADGVSVFWLIGGCFLFKPGKSYAKVLKHNFFHIVIPAVIVCVIAFYFRDFLVNGVSLAESIHHTRAEYLTLLKDLLRWQNSIGSCGHLWYVYAHLIVILCFPVVNAFVTYLDQDVKREKVFLIIVFFLLLVNDTTGDELFAFSHHSINAAVPAATIMIIGHILYRHRDFLIRKRALPLLAAPVIFFGLNAIRVVLQLFIARNRHGGNAIMYWFSSFGVVCAASILWFCLALFQKENGKLRLIISYIGGLTFGIYLIHFLIIDSFYRLGLQDYLAQHVLGSESTFIRELIYTGIMILAVFLCSGIIILIVKTIKDAMNQKKHLQGTG